MKKKYIFLVAVFAVAGFVPLAVLAQDQSEVNKEIEKLKEENREQNKKINANKPGKSSFLFTGFSNLTYHQNLEDTDDSKFAHAGFSPITIWRPSERLMLETELHIEMEGGVHGGEAGDGHGGHGSENEAGHEGTTFIDLGYANMVYFLNDYMIITAGKFLTPIGTFNERFHPSWINPLPTSPLGMGHGSPLPVAELGIQIRGGLQTGISKLNYALYLSNGPVLEDGRGDPERAGSVVYSNFSDNNKNKALGGRLGWLPIHNSSLEIGISGQWAKNVGDEGSVYEKVGSQLVVGDISYLINSTSLKGVIRLTGQYSKLMVDDALYKSDSTDIAKGDSEFYTFDNTSTFYYGLISYRPSKSGKKFIRNIEFVYRYDFGQTPADSKWEFEDARSTFGLNYWIQARSAIKLAVSIGELSNIMYLQWALGF